MTDIDISAERVETLASGIDHLQNSAQMRRLAAEMVRALRTALDEATAERDRLRKEIASRCEHCGGTVSSYGPDGGCPGCGAPQCCKSCCDRQNEYDRAISAEAERDALKALVVQMREALDHVRAIISDGAMDGFNYKYGDWAERLFKSQHVTREALALTPADLAGCVVVPMKAVAMLREAEKGDQIYDVLAAYRRARRAMLNAALTTGGDDADHT